MKFSSVPRFARTVAHLTPYQIFSRVRLRSNRLVLSRRPQLLASRWLKDAAPTAHGWPVNFEPTDWHAEHSYPSAEANADGVFEIHGYTHNVEVDGWRPEHALQLFRFHLHYFDWVWTLAQLRDTSLAKETFTRLFRSWKDGTTEWGWDEWAPYVVSLRAWTLCAVGPKLSSDPTIRRLLDDELWKSFSFLKRNTETDVGGNHLIKNLKALIGLAVFFDERDELSSALDRLIQQIEIQVLEDGGHYELSPSYHIQVLADLVDIHGLLIAASLPVPEPLSEAVERMKSWAIAVRQPDGSMPHVGDSVDVPESLLEKLLGSRTGTDRLTVLDASGYVVVRTDRFYLIVDFGRPCPPHLPGHAQADFGTFVLWIDGKEIVSDPGVSVYVGRRRDYERSTFAHNTLCIDGLDQTEVWSSFRAGRLALPGPIEVSETNDVIMLRCSHNGYRFLSSETRHVRTFLIAKEHVDVIDSVNPALQRQASSAMTFCGTSDRVALSPPADSEARVAISRRHGQSLEAIQKRWTMDPSEKLSVRIRARQLA